MLTKLRRHGRLISVVRNGNLKYLATMGSFFGFLKCEEVNLGEHDPSDDALGRVLAPLGGPLRLDCCSPSERGFQIGHHFSSTC